MKTKLSSCCKAPIFTGGNEPDGTSYCLKCNKECDEYVESSHKPKSEEINPQVTKVEEMSSITSDKVRFILMRCFDNGKYLWGEADVEIRKLITQAVKEERERIMKILHPIEKEDLLPIGRSISEWTRLHTELKGEIVWQNIGDEVLGERMRPVKAIYYSPLKTFHEIIKGI